MKTIYILLTKSTSVTSHIIGRFTSDPYTHSSIAFDDKLTTMYSFARRYSHLPLPAGLVEEKFDRGFLKSQGNIPCALLKLDVPDLIHETAQKNIERMLCHKKHYRYSILGLLACKLHIPLEFHDKYFCSLFVAKVLADSKAVTLPKMSALMRPSDFLSMNCFTQIYNGGLLELKSLCSSPFPWNSAVIETA